MVVVQPSGDDDMSGRKLAHGAPTMDALTIAALIELGALRKEDFDSALQQILRIDAGALHIERVSYWSFRPNPPHIFCELGFQAGGRLYERGAQLSEPESPEYFHELRKGDVLLAPDVSADSRLLGLESYLKSRGVQALLDVPIWVSSEFAGILCHEHGQKKLWSESDVEFALAVSHSLSAALEARQRSGAEATARRNAFLDEVSVRVGRSLDEREIARQAVDLLVPKLADWAVIDLVEQGKIRRVAIKHKNAQALSKLAEAARRFPPGFDRPHLTAMAIRLEQSILHPIVTQAHVARYTINAEHAELIRSLGAGSAIGVPLISGGRLIGALGLNTTARAYQQEDLRLAEDFAERLALAFDNAQLYRKARDAISARDEFLSLASHELRTPLASMNLAVDRLGRLAAKSQVPDSLTLNILTRQIDRLQRLVQQLLDASQIGRGELAINRERIDLAQLVNDLCEESAYALERAGCELRLHIAGPVVGEWDPIKLARLLTNLLDNAMKFAKGEPIDVTVSALPEYALLIVQDHGPGIEPEVVADVFERYTRGVSPQYFGGLGLGLFIVRAIVDAHGGTVKIESRRNEGTTVTVELPFATPTNGSSAS